ncbi:MAG: hypothetical protein L0J54_08765 [Halomonas sp.]|nr:hypothetical protein [Halomonas sp.]MDN6298102.1 hypothetical protein [Halomonas sp.]MDN6315413.1 hypothetical protein [Halomonas sp.]MDN6336707.1 hypothetical protein [Halomonas sp.]
MPAFIRLILVLTGILATTLTLGGCALSPPDVRLESHVLTPAQAARTSIGRAVQERLKDRPDGVSGFYPHPVDNRCLR